MGRKEKEEGEDGWMKGLREVHWPGRGQWVQGNHGVKYWCDGAHTLESMKECLKTWKNVASTKSSGQVDVLVFMCSQNRDGVALLQLIFSEFNVEHAVMVNEYQHQPVYTPDQLQHMQSFLFSLPKHQLKKISFVPCEMVPQVVPSGSHCLVTGSLHLVGEIMRILKVPVT
ncbi:hypothetical protein HMI54_000635 [Coelomomyces lativittatus]|nr:hypothetical protein HMI54_000635 [Coelomomyces lativittatus]